MCLKADIRKVSENTFHETPKSKMMFSDSQQSFSAQKYETISIQWVFSKLVIARASKTPKYENGSQNETGVGATSHKLISSSNLASIQSYGYMSYLLSELSSEK